MSDDVQLVERCLAGDAAALRSLLERFERTVFSLCFQMMRQRQDAEDVCQETLVRLCRHLDSSDRSRPLLPWVLTIAANRCRTALARRADRPLLTESLPEPACLPVEESGLGEELQLALLGLREEYRMAFLLFHQQELSLQDVGEVLEVPVGTVKTWLHRARKELAEKLRTRGFVS